LCFVLFNAGFFFFGYSFNQRNGAVEHADIFHHSENSVIIGIIVG